jgi:hypothetical protein
VEKTCTVDPMERLVFLSEEQVNVMLFLQDDSDNEAHLLSYIDAAGGVEWCKTFRLDGLVYPGLIVHGGTLLHQCLMHTSCVRMNLLIELGVPLNEKDYQGSTVLHHLCGQSPTFAPGHAYAPDTFEYMEFVDKKIRMMVESGADPEIQDLFKRTALIRALSGGWSVGPTVVQTLLDLNADATVEDGEGWTVLHYASFSEDVDSLQTLLDTGLLGINQRSKHDGETAMHVSDLETLPVLLRNGADMSIKNNDGFDALEGWEDMLHHSEIEELLVGAMTVGERVFFGHMAANERHWIEDMAAVWREEVELRRSSLLRLFLTGLFLAGWFLAGLFLATFQTVSLLRFFLTGFFGGLVFGGLVFGYFPDAR